MADTKHPRETRVIINYTEPAPKPPPLLEVGALAWIRKNLFGSALDAFLTILGVVIIVSVVVGMIQWITREADWFSIRFWLDQFVRGSMPPEEVNRLDGTIFFFAVTIGVTIAAYMRRVSLVSVVAVALVVIIPIVALPPVITTLIQPPPIYAVAGNMDIVSGTSTQPPIPQVSFLARAGESITVRYADFGASDEVLAAAHGFIDRPTNALRNAAANRLTAMARTAEIQQILAENETSKTTRGSGMLTARQQAALEAELAKVQFLPTDEAALTRIDQIKKRLDDKRISAAARADLEAELASLTVSPTVTDAYQLNALPVSIRLLNPDYTPMGDAQIIEPGGEVTYAIAADGWYILEKTIAGDTPGIVILSVQGITPIYYDPAEKVYERTQDLYAPADLPPQIDNKEAPYVRLLDFQYRGTRTFSEYLRMYVAPFLTLIAPTIIFTVLVLVAGFVLARQADAQFSPRDTPRMYSRRASTWLLIACPIVMFALVNGTFIEVPIRGEMRTLFPPIIPPGEPDKWGGILLATVITLYGMVFAFPIGILLALGRRANHLPIVSTFCTVVIELVRGTPFIVVLFAGQLLIPLLSPDLANIPRVYRALFATIIFSAAYLAENVRGGLQSIPPGQEEAARALGMPGWKITLYITLPQALRAVIPALVGQFISLFKDTSLLVIVGLLDLNYAVNTLVAKAEFQQTRREGLIFISIIYFVVSYVMAYISRRIEESGSGAARRI